MSVLVSSDACAACSIKLLLLQRVSDKGASIQCSFGFSAGGGSPVAAAAGGGGGAADAGGAAEEKKEEKKDEPEEESDEVSSQ